MRCETCGKFATYGEPQVEVLDFGVSEELATAEVSVTLICGEDDTELKQGTVEASTEIEHTCELESVVAHLLKTVEPEKLGTDDVDKAVADREYEATDCTAEALEGAKGKKNTYGATVTWTLECSACGDSVEITTEVEEEASAFEEVG